MSEVFVESILVADSIAQDVPVLLSKFHDPVSHSRALAYLVCRALLMRTSGDQQILLAYRSIRAMGLTSLETSDSLSLEEVCLVLLILSGIRCSQ